MSSVNPYAPPKANVDEVDGASSDAEAIRREHIRHETAVRSIGALYYFGGGLMLLAGLVLMSGAPAVSAASLPPWVGMLYLALGVLSIVVARGIRRLEGWARTASIVLSVIGLLGFPFGTLINAYILYLLLCAKGKRVFAEDYADIVAATPHVKYRTSIAVWIVLGVFVLFVAGILLLNALS